MADKEHIGKVLVAEDSAPNRNILCHLLKKLGFEVLEAKDGKEARELLSQNSDVCLIISDIMMPEENGIDLVQYTRNESSVKDVPFVFVTAVAEKEYILRAKEYNVNGYMLKPISADKLCAKLKEVFPDKQFRLAS